MQEPFAAQPRATGEPESPTRTSNAGIVVEPGQCAAPLEHRERFLTALRCEIVDRPPLWMMRQAGRCLPEYRQLKEKYSFRDLILNPELAAEVTLQPVYRFDLDAAILFSDILVVPEALGQSFQFRDTGGVQMDSVVATEQDIDNLQLEAVADRLAYVGETLRLIKRSLMGRCALLGFAGSPWTLANFMLEGGSTPNPTKALELFRTRPDLYNHLAWKLTRAVITYLQLQIDSGAEALQLFDSLGGLLPAMDFEAASGRWMRMIITALQDQVPIIVFSKGTRNWPALIDTGAQALGIDHDVDITEAARHIPEDVALQGNLDPGILARATPAGVADAATALLRKMRGRPGYIFNLGHGVLPETPLPNLQTLVDTVRKFA